MAVSAAMFMSSCAKEAPVAGVADGDTAVSFTISLDDATATRATTHGNGLKCDKLVWEVYDVNGDRIDILSGTNNDAFNGGLTETVTITLAKGQTYSFAFWAQNSACTAYNTASLKNVGISYEDFSNEEDRDAFFGNTEPLTVKGNFDHTVVLKRPFAQLNLGVSDLLAAEHAGIKVLKAKVAVSEAATRFDATTGMVSEPVAVEFDSANILYVYGQTHGDNEMLQLKKELTIDGKTASEYPWMAMNYLLVNDATTGAASDNADVTFTLTTDKADIVLHSSNTPLQRNWRTNIIAKLTSVGTFNVVIDPAFDGEYDRELDSNGAVTDYEVVYGLTATAEGYEVASAAAFATVAEIINSGESFQNKTITLSADIDLKDVAWTPINGWNGILNGATIDGQNHVVSNMTVNGGTSCGFISDNASSVTIKNMTFDGAVVKAQAGNGTYAGVVMGKNYSPVTIENVHVVNSIVANNWQCGGLVGFAEGNGPAFVDCSISDSFVGGSNATAGAFFGLGGVDINCTRCEASGVQLYTDMEAGFVGYLYGKALTETECSSTNVTVVSEYPAGF